MNPATVDPADLDDLAGRLRGAGCVFAEQEAAEVLRVRGPGRHDDVVRARAAGVPLEQALGVALFAGVEVAVAPGVFVPRARAAVLVDAAVRVAPDARVLVDLGCGCGALAAALTRRLPLAAAHACDVDPDAVRNAGVNGAAFGFTAHAGDWWRALPRDLAGGVDLAVAYLPHVPGAAVAHIPRDFRNHEPLITVHGGPDGLDPLRAVLADAATWLAPHGVFVTLLADEQLGAAVDLAAALGLAAAFGLAAAPTPPGTARIDDGPDRPDQAEDEPDDDVVLAIRRV